MLARSRIVFVRLSVEDGDSYLSAEITRVSKELAEGDRYVVTISQMAIDSALGQVAIVFDVLESPFGLSEIDPVGGVQ